MKNDSQKFAIGVAYASGISSESANSIIHKVAISRFTFA